jgi:hypothetical protein
MPGTTVHDQSKQKLKQRGLRYVEPLRTKSPKGEENNVAISVPWRSFLRSHWNRMLLPLWLPAGLFHA